MSGISRSLRQRVVLVLLLTAPCVTALALTRNWDAGGDQTNWFDAANWDTGVPVAGDAAVIDGTSTVLLTNSTAALSAFTITNATLTFTNWTTMINATNVTIQSGGVLTHTLCDTNAAISNTNRVYILCSNLTIMAGGSINVTETGYPGGAQASKGLGPGGGSVVSLSGGGGSYGGKGGRGHVSHGSNYGGPTYGSASAPTQPGSGGAGAAGGDSSDKGGVGGGVVRIEASGQVTIDGSITANGGMGSGVSRYGAGGSGGAIYIICDTITGTGVLEAKGANKLWENGGGGGGRIAVAYDTTAQAALPSQPTITFSVMHATTYQTADLTAGTVYFPDNTILPDTPTTMLLTKAYVYGVDAWTLNDLTINNGLVHFMEAGFLCVISNDVLVTGSGGSLYFDIANQIFAVGGDIAVTNGASLHFEQTGTTNTSGQWTNFAARVCVTGTIDIASASTMYLYSHPTNGGAVRVEASNVIVRAGGAINADETGFEGKLDTFGFGPGSGKGFSSSAGGAGHGGKGGQGNHGTSGWGGPTYGSISMPLIPGSAGGGLGPTKNFIGGRGGGVIWIEATEDVTVDGTISADGGQRVQGNGGAGAGGAIYIVCDTFAGSGLIRTDGGIRQFGEGGAGGGGRIAVHYNSAAPGTTVDFSSERQEYTQVTDRYKSNPGTVWLSDSSFYPSDTVRYDALTYYDTNTLFRDSLTVQQDAWFAINSEITITITNDLKIGNTAYTRMDLGQARLTVGDMMVFDNAAFNMFRSTNSFETLTVQNDILLSNGTFSFYFPLTNANALSLSGDLLFGTNGHFYAHSGPTNDSGPGYGGLVDFNLKSVILPTASGIYPVSHPTNGGSVKFMIRDLTIETNATVSASSQGYDGAAAAAGNGSGGGAAVANSGAGGGYGGVGGVSLHGAAAGSTYGDATNQPLQAGSAGGGRTLNSHIGGDGGGLVWLEIVDSLTLNGGSIRANGAAGSTANAGGGAGGGVYIRCYRLKGTTGTFSADGADSGGEGGGGGGGRVGIYRNFHEIGGTNVSAALGTGWNNGATGTIYWGDANLPIPALAPIVTNQTAGPVTLSTALLNGYLLATNQAPTTLLVYWGDEDGGTAIGGWDNTNQYSGYRAPGQFSTNVSLPAANKVYYYRFAGTNWAGTGWASPVETLVAGDVTIAATDSAADEDGPDDGIFTVSRPSWSTNVAITVNYSVGGTASNGDDYVALGGTVDLSVGVASNTIVLTPKLDGYVEGPETVILVILNGAYAVGGASTATVTIADTAVTPTNTWTGTGNWTNLTGWSSAHVPVVNQHAVINGTVTLETATEELASYTLSTGNIQIFNGTGTCINAASVTINGQMTHQINTATETNAAGGWDWDARVYIVCSNLTLTSNGQIDVDAKGYQGGVNASGYGPGRGLATALSGGGGGYGGAGSRGNPGHPNNYGGSTYSSVSAPGQPGSGGGGRTSGGTGGHGGGMVRINATGTVTIDGIITADGSDATVGNSGGGSGGGIYITCRELLGDGQLTADGGNYKSEGGTGGGGRIALNYNASSQAAQSPQPGLTNSVKPLLRYLWSEAGTVYFTDTTLLTESLRDRFASEVYVYGMNSWAPNTLVISNRIIHFAAPSFNLTVTNDLLVTGSSGALHLDIANKLLSVGNDLRVEDGGELYIQSGVTNSSGTWTNWGALVAITNDLLVTGASSTIYPSSDSINGGSIRFTCKNATVTDGGQINADTKGFSSGVSSHTDGYGAGGGNRGANSGGGGAYGGDGGDGVHATSYGGTAFGSLMWPQEPGSGGGDYRANANRGYGGGLVWLQVDNVMTLEGAITANGGSPSGYEAGGSGGGIYIYCSTLKGSSNGYLRANGGDGGSESGAGGGGRIAVWRWRHLWSYTNQCTVTGGTKGHASAEDGLIGTIYWGQWAPPAGTLFIFR